MTIDPLQNSAPLPPAPSAAHSHKKQEATQASAAGDSLSLEKSQMVDSSLKSSPEVRPEVVERGKQLAADPNYPSPEIVNKIAQLITPLDSNS